jgi:glyoxalase family protein
MNTNFTIGGIHHITAIASAAAENLAFYEKVLGLRLVKKTVNFDDPYTYHLYYGNSVGAPGTLLTFFPWEKLSRGKTGAGMVAAVAFSIPTGSIAYWQKRLNLHDIKTKESKRFGDRAIQFEDPHGLQLELIGSPSALPTSIWQASPIPPPHSIIGLHSATALLNSFAGTQVLLTDLMGMVFQDKEDNRYRFKMKNDAGCGLYYDVVVDAGVEHGRQGGGTVHHIAFRTPTYAEQKNWQKLLMARGFSATPIIDRKYFKSVYFHEPGGVLFEIATDPPGFAVDESYEKLGRNLKLPDQYEPMRTAIEHRLPKLQPTGFTHEAARLQN